LDIAEDTTTLHLLALESMELAFARLPQPFWMQKMRPYLGIGFQFLQGCFKYHVMMYFAN